jgi:hypothetical protein
MRLTSLVPLVLIALATCRSTPPRTPPKPQGKADLKIDLVLALENGKCVVRFDRTELKEAENAVAWTAHAVIWQVKSNGCGEKTKEKVDGKALGLRHLKLKGATEPAKWFNRCHPLNLVPARFETPPAFRCDIPSSETGTWEGVYEYEIDGDSIEPADPDIGVRRNG